MAMVTARENEELESMIRRFKKYVENEGILKEYKEKQYYQKPSVKRRLKQKESDRKMKIKNAQKKREKETFSR